MDTKQECWYTLKKVNSVNITEIIKDYEFIPGEDTAMPKSITRYMDKSLKIATTPQTCYTWFNCDEDFLNNKKKQMQYLTHTLPFFSG